MTKRVQIQDDLLRQIGRLGDEVGVKVYAVGGYVRDLVLGKGASMSIEMPPRPVKDIDFVVLGEGPRFAKNVQRRLGGRNLVTYPKFGTAMLEVGEYKLEFVGARKESYREESRKPDVEAADLEADLARRDFTINAMAIALNRENVGELVDPFGGQSDLQRRLLRTPLDPEVTFKDDPLRMMRAVRLATQLGFVIDETTQQAIRTSRERIRIVSQERISEELMKILAAPKPSIGFILLEETGLLEILFPELVAMKGVEEREGYLHKDVFYHTLQVVDNVAKVSDKLPLRFAALVHDIAKPRTKEFKPDRGWTFHGHDDIGARMLVGICRRLKLPKDLMEYAQKLVRLHLRPIALADEGVTDSAIRRLLVQAGDDVEDLVTLCRADVTSRNPKRVREHLRNFDYVVQRMREVEEKDRMRAFQSPVRGEEIMAVCGIAPGPMVGKLKKRIEEAILDGEIPNEHDAAYEYLLKIRDRVLGGEEG